jgi:3'(2'), 5'-bisphosphate nucleotidase
VDIIDSIAGIPTDDILKIVRETGWGASDVLRSYYRGGDHAEDLNVQEKKDGPVTAADIAANHYILDKLTAALGQDDFGYLSEETYKSRGDKSAFPDPWLWIIDPLDGTRDFVDKTGEYALHIALTHRGRPVLSVVVCPELDKLYFAALGKGAYVETPNGDVTRLEVSKRDRPEDLVVVVSRTHRDDRFNALLRRLPCQNQLAVGSVGGKVAAIVDQRADVYISLSGKSAPKDWDMAAPELILTEAGGKFTYADGKPLQYNRGDVNQWGCLLASNGYYHQDLLDSINATLAEIDQA